MLVSDARVNRLFIVTAMTFSFSLPSSEASATQVALAPLVQKFDPIQSGGVVNYIQPYAVDVNRQGHLVFSARVQYSPTTFFEGLFLLNDDGLEVILRENDPAPGGNTFRHFSPQITDQGDILTYSYLNTTINDTGVYRYRDGNLSLLARYGDSLPDGAKLTGMPQIPMVDSQGRLVMIAWSPGYPGAPPVAASGVYVGDRTAGYQTLLRTGEPATPGTAWDYIYSAIPSNDQVYLHMGLTGGAGSAHVRHNGQTLQILTSKGDPLPRGGVVYGVGEMSVNDAGDVVSLVGVDNLAQVGVAILWRRGDERVTAVRQGDIAPQGLGAFTEYLRKPAIGPSGSFAFNSLLAGRTIDRDSGLFLWQPTGEISKIAVEGELTPDGTATFGSFSDPSPIGMGDLNAADQMVFRAYIREQGATQNIEAVYHWDRQWGLTEIVRFGDEFDSGNVEPPAVHQVAEISILDFSDAGKILLYLDSNRGAGGIFEATINRPGDFNHDGRIDGSDLEVWTTSYGDGTAADADGDGKSDGNDFLIWQRHCDAATIDATAAAIPEPNSLALAVLVAGVLFSVPKPITRRR